MVPRQNAGLAVVGMLLGAFLLIAAACITAVSLTGSSPPKPTPSGAIDLRLTDAGWHRESLRSAPLGTSEPCGPGWNGGATARSRAVYAHYTGQREDAEAVIALTVYRSPADAVADLVRASSDDWLECHRDEMQEESDPGTTAVVWRLGRDRLAPGVAYSYRYMEGSELDAGTIQYVVVGASRATVSCECPTWRQDLARTVSAALAESDPSL